jgi:hypothetical protein
MINQPLTDPTAGEHARQVRLRPDLRQPVLDPTAGERARQVAAHPEVARPITDPTDPRYGSPSPGE